MKALFLALCMLCSFVGFTQTENSAIQSKIIIKTNILNLLAHRPTLSVEKFFTNSFSTELSFVSGQFNDVLLTDHYDYSGFLLRAKKYLSEVEPNELNQYFGAYIGNLKRNIHTQGQTDVTGWFGYPTRHFTASSIRLGGSVGMTYLSKSKIFIDAQSSLGFGKYLKVDKANQDGNTVAYLDFQIWLSVGFCF